MKQARYPGLILFILLLTAISARDAAAADPWMWDQDENGIDDRLTAVAIGGLLEAYENGDPNGRLRFEVGWLGELLQYGGCVRFDHAPTPTDSLRLTQLGASVVSRFEYVPYIRIRATYPSIVAIAAQPDVERVESTTLLYPLNWLAARSAGARAGRGLPWPTVDSRDSLSGEGVVVAVLDTGINDSALGGFPGHQDLAGKVVGGACFVGPGPIGYTPADSSMNPSQSSLGLTSYHGTHVAATIAGGAPGQPLAGLAPGARLVNVKVLDDGGRGYSLAEALEWCIRNRDRDWGTGATGIDIVNLSLSGPDASDGLDCACQMVNAARSLGMIVVAAAGNSAWSGAIPPPAAADGALAVAASDPAGTDQVADDVQAAFSNAGPRHGDADLDSLDELKPELAAAGVGVISAWGSPLGSGLAHRPASGSSMSAAVASGSAALLLQANPALTPETLENLLIDTARHRPSPPPSADPRWEPGWGFGAIDLAAALEEVRRPGRTQFVSLDARWNDTTHQAEIDWSTQRETDLTGFELQRAPDAGGAPGSFVTVSPAAIPALGGPGLTPTNRTSYATADTPAGGSWWYRVATTGGTAADLSPAAPVLAAAPDGVARLEIHHAVPQSDLSLTIGSGANPLAPLWSGTVALPGALESITAPLLGENDRDHYTAFVELVAGPPAGPALPPWVGEPLWLRADEAGRPDASGEIDGFEVLCADSLHASGTSMPVATSEGNASYAWIPGPGLSAVPPGAGPPTRPWSAGPNPFRDRLTIELTMAPDSRGTLDIFDASGRLVRRLVSPGAGLSPRLDWDGRDGLGRIVPAGRYYLRLERPEGRQVLPVIRLR